MSIIFLLAYKWSWFNLLQFSHTLLSMGQVIGL